MLLKFFKVVATPFTWLSYFISNVLFLELITKVSIFRCKNGGVSTRKKTRGHKESAWDILGFIDTPLAKMVPLKCHNSRFFFQRLILCRRKQTSFITF